MFATRYLRDLNNVGAFIWDNVEVLFVILLIVFIFGGYYFFGIYLFQKRKKIRNWKIEIMFIVASLICAECWFWMAEGARLLREGNQVTEIIDQNEFLLIPAVSWYLGLFLTRFKNISITILAVLLGAAGLLGLLFVNVFYFVGTP